MASKIKKIILVAFTLVIIVTVVATILLGAYNLLYTPITRQEIRQYFKEDRIPPGCPDLEDDKYTNSNKIKPAGGCFRKFGIQKRSTTPDLKCAYIGDEGCQYAEAVLRNYCELSILVDGNVVEGSDEDYTLGGKYTLGVYNTPPVEDTVIEKQFFYDGREYTATYTVTKKQCD